MQLYIISDSEVKKLSVVHKTSYEASSKDLEKYANWGIREMECQRLGACKLTGVRLPVCGPALPGNADQKAIANR